jgi:hypothetical protein
MSEQIPDHRETPRRLFLAFTVGITVCVVSYLLDRIPVF